MTDLRDPTQFNDAYQQLHPVALAVANRVLRDEAAAEDVVQDVFMELWRRPAMFHPQRGSLRGYVTMLARSRAVDRWRTRTARESAVERTAEQERVNSPSEEGAAGPVIRRERSRTLLTVLQGLPSDQRDAVLMAYGRGLTAQEIARASGIPLGTAKSRLRLGLRKARESLQAAAA